MYRADARSLRRGMGTRCVFLLVCEVREIQMRLQYSDMRYGVRYVLNGTVASKMGGGTASLVDAEEKAKTKVRSACRSDSG